jgi:cold shock CspA family protein
MTGRIKKLIRDKGFGFITADESGEDFFMHRLDVLGFRFNEFEEGDYVTFLEVEPRPEKGRRARAVQLVETAHV